MGEMAIFGEKKKRTFHPDFRPCINIKSQSNKYKNNETLRRQFMRVFL